MQNECIICYNNINNNIECNTIYNFHQECNCFYNVHSKCLVEWVKKYKTCIHCHKPLSYTIKTNFDISNINMITETNNLTTNTHVPFRPDEPTIFRCCNIL